MDARYASADEGEPHAAGTSGQEPGSVDEADAARGALGQLSDLPIELVHEILSYLSPQQVAEFRRVSHAGRAAVDDVRVWRDLLPRLPESVLAKMAQYERDPDLDALIVAVKSTKRTVRDSSELADAVSNPVVTDLDFVLNAQTDIDLAEYTGPGGEPFPFARMTLHVTGHGSLTVTGPSDTVASGHAKVTHLGGATVTVSEHARLLARGNARVEASGDARVAATDTVDVNARDRVAVAILRADEGTVRYPDGWPVTLVDTLEELTRWLGETP